MQHPHVGLVARNNQGDLLLEDVLILEAYQIAAANLHGPNKPAIYSLDTRLSARFYSYTEKNSAEEITCTASPSPPAPVGFSLRRPTLATSDGVE
jgi:hypothetical protein